MFNHKLKIMSPRTPEQFEGIREEKKKLIMDAALELFANEGYHSTSISKIAKAAGISKGLMYNYFSSKEELLEHIFHDIMGKVMNMLDPNQDDIISKKEAEDFFDRFFDVLIQNPNEWKLFYQLSIQKEVWEFLMKENMNQQVNHNQQLILNYFAKQNFKDPEVAVLLFSSLFKGFTLIYAFAPDMFTPDLLERFKKSMKDLFIKQDFNENGEPMQLNEKLGYFLL